MQKAGFLITWLNFQTPKKCCNHVDIQVGGIVEKCISKEQSAWQTVHALIRLLLLDQFELTLGLYEPCHEKNVFLHMRKQRRRSASRSFAVTAKLISAFVFATWIVQSLYFLSTKFQASNHLVWSCSLVCVGSGRKPRRSVFSQRGLYSLFCLKT